VAPPSETAEPNRSDLLAEKVRLQQLDLLMGQLKALPALPAELVRSLNAAADPNAGAAPPALAARLAEAFGPTGGTLDRQGFWRHGLAVALAAERIAGSAARPISAPLAFVCGLLHDVGKIALDVCLPKSYARVLASVAGGRGNIAEVERRVIGFDHTLAGRRLARHWRLADRLEQAIWLHHQPVQPGPAGLEGAPLIAAVQLADDLARRKRLGFSGNHVFGAGGEALAELLGLPGGAVEEVAEALTDRIARRHRPAIDSAAPPAPAPGPKVGASEPAKPLADDLRGLRQRADALGELCDFLARAGEAADLGQLCREVAAVASTVLAPADAARPAAAFCFCDENVILAAGRAGEAGTVRLSPAAGAPGAAPDDGLSGAEALANVLDPPDAWSDLIDLNACTCLPLEAEGGWVGGILLPGRPTADGTVREAVRELAAFALAAAVERDLAQRLGEQLALSRQTLAETREAMAQMQLFEAVAEMAAGAAHELNNPLAVISGRAQILAQKVRTKAQRQMAELIVGEAEKIAEIAGDLLDFARPAPPSPAAVSVEKLFGPLRKAFRRRGKAKTPGVRVDIAVEPGCPPVRADAKQVQDVLAELVRNAAEAADGPVNVRLEARRQDGADSVLIAVRDNGPGMDRPTRASAFTPFFSGRAAGRGRGMGLARAQRRVQANGGRIWIESRPGSGTTVFLELPAAGKQAGK